MFNYLRDRFRHWTIQRNNPEQCQQLRDELWQESTLNQEYLVLIIGSCTIATFGLLSNSTAVIIGAMIIAPLMLPIRGLAFGALTGDIALFRQGLWAVLVGTLLAGVIATGLGWLIPLPSFGSEVLARSKPNLLDLGIAVVAGAISGYAKVEPKIAGSLAGTAIAVALMPPICVVGLGLAQQNWSLSLGAILLYCTNLLGITLACMVTFVGTGYSPIHQARKAITWTLALTSALAVPLSASFLDLVQQARLEVALRNALLNRTITFQRLQLLQINTNWLTTPPQVRLSVRAQEPVTPRQVQLLEQFLKQETGQAFTLIFEVGQVTEVRQQPDNSGLEQ